MQKRLLPGAFAFPYSSGMVRAKSYGNLFHEVYIPMTMPMERVEDRILFIRGIRVMLDADLAEIYGVPTKALNQAIKRNADRFPEDFAFRLTAEEKTELVTNCDRFSREAEAPDRILIVARPLVPWHPVDKEVRR